MDLKSNEPLRMVKNGLPASYPSLHCDAECDVPVIGGGIGGGITDSLIAVGFISLR